MSIHQLALGGVLLFDSQNGQSRSGNGSNKMSDFALVLSTLDYIEQPAITTASLSPLGVQTRNFRKVIST
jgi:hypothetical protein